MDNPTSKTTQFGKTTFIINDITSKPTTEYSSTYLIQQGNDYVIRAEIMPQDGIAVGKFPVGDYNSYHSSGPNANYDVRMGIGTSASPTFAPATSNVSTAQGELAYTHGRLYFNYKDPVTGNYTSCYSKQNEGPATFMVDSHGAHYILSDGSIWNYAWGNDRAVACNSLKDFSTNNHLTSDGMINMAYDWQNNL